MSLKPAPKSKFKKFPAIGASVVPKAVPTASPAKQKACTSLPPTHVVTELNDLKTASPLKAKSIAIKDATQPVEHCSGSSTPATEQQPSVRQINLETSAGGNGESGGDATNALSAIASAVIHAINRSNQTSQKKRSRQSRANGQYIDLEQAGFLRLENVLSVFPVSRASWYAGIQEGKYPKSEPLGPRARGWRKSDIKQLIDGISKDHGPSKQAVRRSTKEKVTAVTLA